MTSLTRLFSQLTLIMERAPWRTGCSKSRGQYHRHKSALIVWKLMRRTSNSSTTSKLSASEELRSELKALRQSARRRAVRTNADLPDLFSMFYEHTDGEKYLLNLLDTPGHADFSSELLRSLLPSQGALLLVDAAQVRE